ncbi:CocE/NonD family hydrolase [Streptomyces sp. NPDC001617]
MASAVAWVAEQPWSDGTVGMYGRGAGTASRYESPLP